MVPREMCGRRREWKRRLSQSLVSRWHDGGWRGTDGCCTASPSETGVIHCPALGHHAARAPRGTHEWSIRNLQGMDVALSRRPALSGEPQLPEGIDRSRSQLRRVRRCPTGLRVGHPARADVTEVSWVFGAWPWRPPSGKSRTPGHDIRSGVLRNVLPQCWVPADHRTAPPAERMDTLPSFWMTSSAPGLPAVPEDQAVCPALV